MAQNNAEIPLGRTALGGASCGLTYDAARLDAVAREQRLRRPLRPATWRETRPLPSPVDRERETADMAGADRRV